MGTRKRKGGRLLAQGANGCTYAPAVRCDGESKRRNGVSKLMRFDAAATELEMVERLKQIDPKMEYSVYWNDVCVAGLKSRTPEEIQEDGPTTDCGVRKPDTLLTGPFGGIGLDKVQDPVKLANSLLNVFIGLAEYHKNDFVHSDIKDDNFLFLNDKTRFIDFGNSDDLRNMSEADNDGVVRYLNEVGDIAWPSPHVPPEASFLNKNFDDGKRLTKDEMMDVFGKNFKDEDNPQRYDFETLWAVYPKTKQDAIEIAKKQDIFQMGFTLYRLIALDKLNFDKTNELIKLGKILTRIDPRARPTAEQARDMYAKSIGVPLDSYFSTPLIGSQTATTPVLKKLERQVNARNLLPPSPPQPRVFDKQKASGTKSRKKRILIKTRKSVNFV